MSGARFSPLVMSFSQKKDYYYTIGFGLVERKNIRTGACRFRGSVRLIASGALVIYVARTSPVRDAGAFRTNRAIFLSVRPQLRDLSLRHRFRSFSPFPNAPGPLKNDSGSSSAA